MFKSIEKEAEAEIVEKKSRFIAQIFAVNSKEEAEQVLANVKKKYYDAKHNCYAYIVDNIEKCSDDGEPSGTAGAPMLDLLKNNGLNNIIVVVTRYFGGTLLGTGGLVRAYTESAKKALENAKMIEKEYGIRYLLEISYGNIKEIQYICKQLKINIIDSEYGENVILTLESNEEKKKKLENSGIEIKNEKILNGKIIINIV
mgnify:FL=1